MIDRLIDRATDMLIDFVTPAERFRTFDEPTFVERRDAAPDIDAAYAGPERRRTVTCH